jgi:hypothetical protein
LERGQSTDHDDPWSQTSPETFHAQVVDNLTGGKFWRFVQNGDNTIGWMGNDGAKDTSNVTGQEGDDELFSFCAVGSWFWDDVCVKHLNGFLEAREFHHGVWDLSEPKWFKTLVEWVASFFGHLAVSFSHVGSVTWHGLNPDLHGFEWSQEHVSEKFCGCRSGQVQTHSVGESLFFTDNTRVHNFESFVESKFTDSLGRVTDQSWCPTFGQTFASVFGEGDLESGTEVLVFSGVNLKSTFDEIEWDNSQMGHTAREHTTEGAEAVEFGGSYFARVVIGASDSLGVSHF